MAKSGPAGQVEYYYDLTGRLLGSYGAAAVVREEIVWLGDLPVGTIQGGAAYHIAPDHLGTPHQIVNSANAQVWYWDHHPFGATRSITAAAGFRHELRFPGHIYDSETGLHNNGFRDYWPFIGRYIESDPIGIAGGIGTYSYAGNNPVNAIDPFGLDPKSGLDDVSITNDGSPYSIEAQVAPIPPVVVGVIRTAATAFGRAIAWGWRTATETTRVGRWMSKAEYDAMRATRRVQESFSGTTHVANPADASAFLNQAKPGSLYAEFNVPTSSLKTTNEGWSKVIGPNSLEGRLAARKGLPIPQMPAATDIVHSATKLP